VHIHIWIALISPTQPSEADGRFAKSRDHLKHLVRKAPDVEDVFALVGLRRPVRLQVNQHQFGARIAGPKYVPLPHRGRTAPTHLRINP
jgi:hypothetical protein